MQEVELVEGDRSHPPLNDDVSDVSLFNFYDYVMEYEYCYIKSYHDSPIRPKWAARNIQTTGDLVGVPLDTKKTRSQFHKSLSTCDLNIPERCFLMVGYDPNSYEESSHEPIWKKTMQEEFKSFQDNETWELVPLPSKRKLVHCKWVYRTNMDANGSYMNYKVKLFSKVFSKFHGVME